MVYLDISDDLWYACIGDDVTCAYHGTSSKVTNKLLGITIERKEISPRGWSHCFYLVNKHLVTCNLTLFTCHRMTVNWGQIFNFILLGKNKNIFNTSWREEHVCAIKNRHSLAQKLAAKNCSCRKCYLFSSDLTWVLNRAEETVGDHSPGPENVYSCRRLEGPDMFRKRAPFEKIVGQIRWLFRFWRGSPLAPKSSAPWKSETYFVCFFF